MKNYLLRVISLCSEEQFGQDAVEWAVLSGYVKLTCNLQQDLRQIMGEPGQPEMGLYPEIVEGYRRTCRDHEAALVEIHESSGLLEEILRPVPSVVQQAT